MLRSAACLLLAALLVSQGAAAIDCTVNAIFYDSNNHRFRIEQHGLNLTVTPLDTTWSATGVIDPSPNWCPYDGSATIQSPCHPVLFTSKQTPKLVSAVLSHECDVLLSWSNGAEPWVVPDLTLRDIHVVSMTHLDVGFTDTARNVCDLYLDTFFPKAFATSAALAERGGAEQFIWTEFPWLIVEYLKGYAGCAHRLRTEAEIEAMENAIAQGWIQWHANALNNFIELEDAGMFNFSLSLREMLNARFNTTHGRLVGKHSDVPGMSRSAIPLLNAKGVRAYHIGFNGACKLPESLPPMFVWRHPETHTELLTFVENNYGNHLRAPNSPIALYFHYKVDNTGPPSPDEVISFWHLLYRRFPNANIKASSLDAYAATILNNATLYNSLPVITDEIGDSWLYGSPADPIKLATFREARRFLDLNVKQGKINPECEYYTAYNHRLLKGPAEHNWGFSIGGYLPNARTSEGNWSNVLFEAVRDRSDYQDVEAEWAEQRGFCHALPTWSPLQRRLQCAAQDALAWEEFYDQLEFRLDCIRRGIALPDEPTVDESSLIEATLGEELVCGRFVVNVDPSTAAITNLYDSLTGATWSKGPGNPLALLSYRTFTTQDFDRFNLQYNPNCGPPCGDFNKQGMETANPESRVWLPRVQRVLASPRGVNTSDPCHIKTLLALDQQAVVKYGGAEQYTLEYTIPGSQGAAVDIALSWTNKTATRLAEALFLSFTPATPATPNWFFDILGYPMDPLRVVANGTRHLHAVWDGVGLTVNQTHNPNAAPLRFFVKSRDVPLVAPGDTNHLLWFDGDENPDMAGGAHFNVHNNLWGTAFPQWYGDNGRAVFQIFLD